jgi:uncharacterized membrane protein YsdA (DUF1294 family)
MTPTQILLGLFIAINTLSFFLVAHDKRKSTKGNYSDRTPEGLFFFLATIYGGIGVYLGMLIFRHKTRKWYFQIGIPLIILQNLVTLYLVREIFFI